MQPKKSELVGGIAKFREPETIPWVWRIQGVSPSIRDAYDESGKYF
jgi:hypothetical protein